MLFTYRGALSLHRLPSFCAKVGGTCLRQESNDGTAGSAAEVTSSYLASDRSLTAEVETVSGPLGELKFDVHVSELSRDSGLHAIAKQ